MIEAADVVVLGAGPAGCAAAIALAGRGRGVVLVGRHGPSLLQVGESLPPAANPVLERLGIAGRLARDGHLQCCGNDFLWGSEVLGHADFIFSAYGQGWHLDRPAFDAALRAAAAAAGADVRCGTAVTALDPRGDGGWVLSLQGEHDRRHLACDWVVDCSGRSSWFARQRGVQRIAQDRLVASAVMFERAADAAVDEDDTTLVEAVPGGWWYTARVPGRRRVVVFHTDYDLEGCAKARDAAGWQALLAQTYAVRHRVAGYAPAHQRQFAFAANGARLARLHGERWLAGGDAAASFDPLSSQGILTALHTGTAAGEAVDAALGGDATAVRRYAGALEAYFERYAANGAQVYGRERRWPAAPFWQRRHAPSDVRRPPEAKESSWT